MATAVELDLTREQFVVLDEVRTRPDNAHVSAQDVDELGKLVEARPAQEMSKRIYPAVALSDLTTGVGLTIHTQGAELINREGVLFGPGAFLGVE